MQKWAINCKASPWYDEIKFLKIKLMEYFAYFLSPFLYIKSKCFTFKLFILSSCKSNTEKGGKQGKNLFIVNFLDLFLSTPSASQQKGYQFLVSRYKCFCFCFFGPYIYKYGDNFRSLDWFSYAMLTILGGGEMTDLKYLCAVWGLIRCNRKRLKNNYFLQGMSFLSLLL